MTVILNSMHKYIPRLNIVEVNNSSMDPKLSSKHIFTFPETQFIAVTAYQNTDVSYLLNSIFKFTTKHIKIDYSIKNRQQSIC